MGARLPRECLVWSPARVDGKTASADLAGSRPSPQQGPATTTAPCTKRGSTGHRDGSDFPAGTSLAPGFELLEALEDAGLATEAK